MLYPFHPKARIKLRLARARTHNGPSHPCFAYPFAIPELIPFPGLGSTLDKNYS
jgi:hypothetical protein